MTKGLKKKSVDSWDTGDWKDGGPQGLFPDYEIIPFDSIFDAKGGGKGKPAGSGDDGDSTTPTLVGTYTSGDATIADSAEFNIDIEFYGSWTDDLKADFIWAADYLSTIITGDVADIGNFFGEFVDDIVIEASLVDIDGPGGVLGQAGPTYIRTDGGLPVAAIM